MRYIVAKRKLMRRLDVLEKNQSQTIDDTIEQIKNLEEGKMSPHEKLKEILKKSSEVSGIESTKRQQEARDLISQMRDADGLVRQNSKLLMKLKSNGVISPQKNKVASALSSD